MAADARTSVGRQKSLKGCSALAIITKAGDGNAAMRHRFFLLIFALLTGCGEGEKPRDRPPPLVTIAAVAPHQFVDRFEAIGTAEANEQVSVTAPVTERITQLGFSDGDFVRRGQVLAVLAQGQESASLSSAAAQARVAEQQLSRISALRARGFATKSSLDTQVAAVASARAGTNEARASLADRVIRAPFSGYVSLRKISVGAVVGAGTEIAVISDLSRIKLDFAIPETSLASVRVGQSIKAVSAAYPNEFMTGTISAIDPVIDPQTRSVIVRAVLPNGGARLKPGMLLNVTIEARTRSSVAVPELAIVQEGDARFVYIIGKDEKAARLPIRTGGREGNLIEVIDGLNAGQAIVTEGIVKLSEGIKVRTGKEGPPRDPKRAR